MNKNVPHVNVQNRHPLNTLCCSCVTLWSHSQSSMKIHPWEYGTVRKQVLILWDSFVDDAPLLLLSGPSTASIQPVEVKFWSNLAFQSLSLILGVSYNGVSFHLQVQYQNKRQLYTDHHIIQGRHHCHARFEATTTHNNNHIIIIFSLSCIYIYYIYIFIYAPVNPLLQWPCFHDTILDISHLSQSGQFFPAPLHDGHGAPFCWKTRCDLWDANAEVFLIIYI